MQISAYWKTVVAGVFAVIYAVNEGVIDSVWTADDTTKAIAAVVAVVGVWVVPNRPRQLS
jgi:hypothetical protein